MRITIAAILAFASLAAAQCPPSGTQKVGACASPPPTAVLRVYAPAPVYVAAPAPAPAVVYFAAPVPVYYAAPAAAVVVQPKRQYATPVRDFLFGR